MIVEFTVTGEAAERFPSHCYRRALPPEYEPVNCLPRVNVRRIATNTVGLQVETCVLVRACMDDRYKPDTAERDIEVTLLPTHYSNSKQELVAGRITVTGRTPRWSNAEVARVVRAELGRA